MAPAGAGVNVGREEGWESPSDFSTLSSVGRGGEPPLMPSEWNMIYAWVRDAHVRRGSAAFLCVVSYLSVQYLSDCKHFVND